MQICPSYDYERKDIKDWSVFDWLDMLRNVADYYEFNGKMEASEVLNKLARQLLDKEVRDYNKRKQHELIKDKSQ